MKIDMNKTYTYRNGEPARILCVDSPHPNFPVVSVTKEGEVFKHSPDGGYAITRREHNLDLIEKKNHFYVNVFGDGTIGRARNTRQECEKLYNSERRKACIRVEYTEGQFDD